MFCSAAVSCSAGQSDAPNITTKPDQNQLEARLDLFSAGNPKIYLILI